MVEDLVVDEDVFAVLASRDIEEARGALLSLLLRARLEERALIAAELQGMHAEYLHQGRHGTSLQLLGEAARFVADPGERAVANATRRGKRVRDAA